MKASELVKLLTKAIAEHGDRDVVLAVASPGEWYEVEGRPDEGDTINPATIRKDIDQPVRELLLINAGEFL